MGQHFGEAHACMKTVSPGDVNSDRKLHTSEEDVAGTELLACAQTPALQTLWSDLTSSPRPRLSYNVLLSQAANLKRKGNGGSNSLVVVRVLLGAK